MLKAEIVNVRSAIISVFYFLLLVDETDDGTKE